MLIDSAWKAQSLHVDCARNLFFSCHKIPAGVFFAFEAFLFQFTFRFNVVLLIFQFNINAISVVWVLNLKFKLVSFKLLHAVNSKIKEEKPAPPLISLDFTLDILFIQLAPVSYSRASDHNAMARFQAWIISNSFDSYWSTLSVEIIFNISFKASSFISSTLVYSSINWKIKYRKYVRHKPERFDKILINFMLFLRMNSCISFQILIIEPKRTQGKLKF